MNRQTGWVLAAFAAMLSLVAAPAVAGCGDNPGCAHKAFFTDGEKYDLSDMYDGETRYFGSGDSEVEATRTGDQVVLSFSDDDSELTEITCELSSESCFVVSSEGDDAAKIMVMKSAEAHGEMTHDVMVMEFAGDVEQLHSGDHAITIDVEAGEDGNVFFSKHGNEKLQWISEGDEGAAKVIRIALEPSGTTVRCPEGDATLRLDEGESTGGYFCPKHNVELEVVESPKRLHHRKVIRVEEDE